MSHTCSALCTYAPSQAPYATCSSPAAAHRHAAGRVAPPALQAGVSAGVAEAAVEEAEDLGVAGAGAGAGAVEVGGWSHVCVWLP
jgi:hypothetical protein